MSSLATDKSTLGKVESAHLWTYRLLNDKVPTSEKRFWAVLQNGTVVSMQSDKTLQMFGECYPIESARHVRVYGLQRMQDLYYALETATTSSADVIKKEEDSKNFDQTASAAVSLLEMEVERVDDKLRLVYTDISNDCAIYQGRVKDKQFSDLFAILCVPLTQMFEAPDQSQVAELMKKRLRDDCRQPSVAYVHLANRCGDVAFASS